MTHSNPCLCSFHAPTEQLTVTWARRDGRRRLDLAARRSAQRALTHLQMLLLGFAGGQPQHSLVEAADERPGAGICQQQHAAGQHLHGMLCVEDLRKAVWRLNATGVPWARHSLRCGTASRHM